ncbi:MAG: hypothetical protein KC776_08730 [Myxococcales bacterium]|nr:hypothetical protein [Myxococcales bacterium]MCB9576309.1 hypothetical protein [Polyangiaceae bacterium]
MRRAWAILLFGLSACGSGATDVAPGRGGGTEPMDARVEVDAAAESGIDAGSDAQQASPCPKLPEEIVGNDVDDDCDGLVDEWPADISAALHMRPALWEECGAASTDYGLNRPIVMATHGAVAGAINLRALHPACPIHSLPMSLDQVRAWAKSALEDPMVDGIALDHEGWTLSLGEPMLKVLFSEAEKAGKIFCDVPSMYLNHLMNGMTSFSDMISSLQKHTHCASPWRYHLKGPEYLALGKAWIDGGYAHPIIPMGDAGMRPDYGGITQADAVATVNTLADHGVSFALFQPKYDDGTVLSVMAKRYP